MNAVLDSLVIYTLENGSLTSAATVASMICWVAMPQSLYFRLIVNTRCTNNRTDKIFLAIHVAIAKREFQLYIPLVLYLKFIDDKSMQIPCWRPSSRATNFETVGNLAHMLFLYCSPAVP
jgi:hypothetical protein